ncbi:ATP-binding Cassette (ABC) Superfamily, partial [Achlya hypogyna]
MDASADYEALQSPAAAAKAPKQETRLHPLESSNCVSIFLMTWLDGLIRRGAIAPLSEADIWPLRKADTAGALHARFQREWAAAGPNADFYTVIWKTLRREIYASLFIYNIYAVPMLLQPAVINSLLEYLAYNPETATAPLTTMIGITSGYGLAGLLTALSFISVTIIDFGQYVTSLMGCHAKAIVMDVAYQKSLRLAGTVDSGDVVTLAAVDSERLFQGFMLGTWVVAAPVSLLAMYVLLGFEMGYVVGLSGGGTMFLMLYVGHVSAKTVGDARLELLRVQAERVKLTNELLQGVRVVKMYGWEAPVEAQVAAVRNQELFWLQKYQNRRMFNTIALTIAPILSLALCLLVYVAQGFALTPSVAFTALAYMNVARLPCMTFSNAILFVQEARTSCDRVTRYLHIDEMPVSETPAAASGDCVVEITGGDFSWHASTSTPHDPSLPLTLRNITLRLEPKSLTIVVGAVGSGKSSLVSALLGEIHQVAGSRCVQGDIAYVSQEAWIQHDSLRNNVLFTAPMDESKYERKARVSLARAMYRTDADVVLLDDPLSALDVHVAGAVFRDCVQGLLADKTTLLVLNSHYHFLPHADRVLVMVDGAIAADGSFDVVKEQFPHLQSFSDVDVNDEIKDTAVVSAPPAEPEAKASGELVKKEDRATGAVSKSVYITYLGSSGSNGYIVAAVIIGSFSVAQGGLSMMDWFMGYWSTHASMLANRAAPWIYLGIAVVSVLMVWGRSLYTLVLAVNCSKNLHEKLFQRVISAPVNSFFDVTPVGRILNRFSSDLDQVDSQLPFFGLMTLQFLFQIVAIVIICAVSSPYILLVYLPLVLVFYQIQVYYNKTSAELKRMDSVTRSPVVNSIAETINGLSTIRAFKMTAVFAERGRDVLDYNQRFFLVYRLATRWLQMRLDWLSASIIAGVAFITVASKDSIGVVAAGLALTYAAQMSSFFSKMTSSFSFIDNMMTSVERLEHFKSLAAEGDSRA